MNDYLFCKYTLENDPRAVDYSGFGYAPDFTLDRKVVENEQSEEVKN